MKTYIVTGGNRGLGFSIAANLAKSPSAEVVLAVRDLKRGNEAASKIGPNVSVKELNMSSPISIERFMTEWEKPIEGLVNNAGVRIVDSTRRTEEEGYEETFAVNHLYALKLTVGLMGNLRGGRVLFIGSGTHNPKNRTATVFGFRGALYESIQKCAQGLHSSPKIAQLGMDRYATSKFLNMVSTAELSRRLNPSMVAFYCLDPGLMPGTGLARTAPPYLRFAWKYILPILARTMPDTSTTKKSGQAGAWLMTADKRLLNNGGIYSYDRKLSSRVWEKVYDPAVGRIVINESFGLLGFDHEILNAIAQDRAGNSDKASA
jgi:NAD(P)-dependent dehydrogenase (short-subunit alcohol dehydrogenase family)